MNEYVPGSANYLTALNTVQVTPEVVGVELNDPGEFKVGKNQISIARLTMGAYARFARHTHPYNHVLVIQKGGGFLEIDGGDGVDSRLEFGEGDIFNVPGIREHAVSAGPEGVTMLSIGSPPMHLIGPERMVFVREAESAEYPRLVE